MANTLYLTTECIKLSIDCVGGIDGLTLRVFMTHSRLSKMWETGKAYRGMHFEKWSYLVWKVRNRPISRP